MSAKLEIFKSLFNGKEDVFAIWCAKGIKAAIGSQIPRFTFTFALVRILCQVITGSYLTF